MLEELTKHPLGHKEFLTPWGLIPMGNTATGKMRRKLKTIWNYGTRSPQTMMVVSRSREAFVNRPINLEEMGLEPETAEALKARKP